MFFYRVRLMCGPVLGTFRTRTGPACITYLTWVYGAGCLVWDLYNISLCAYRLYSFSHMWCGASSPQSPKVGAEIAVVGEISRRQRADSVSAAEVSLGRPSPSQPVLHGAEYRLPPRPRWMASSDVSIRAMESSPPPIAYYDRLVERPRLLPARYERPALADDGGHRSVTGICRTSLTMDQVPLCVHAATRQDVEMLETALAYMETSYCAGWFYPMEAWTPTRVWLIAVHAWATQDARLKSYDWEGMRNLIPYVTPYNRDVEPYDMQATVAGLARLAKEFFPMVSTRFGTPRMRVTERRPRKSFIIEECITGSTRSRWVGSSVSRPGLTPRRYTKPPPWSMLRRT